MKHEWKKHEKLFYQPKAKPEFVTIPEFGFFSIRGKGNPNDEFFADYIGVLYSLAYAVKMSPKKGITLPGFFDYTVYPLEGVWDLTEDAKANKKAFDKNDLVFNLMIRQPDFLTTSDAQVFFERIHEGPVIQMLHLGSYDDEPASFSLMEEYAGQNGLKKISKVHREIYLSDARKVAPEKLKTVLRFSVE